MNFKIAKHEYEFQMTSFVDVIFVLLSFFVLGSQFTTLEKDFGMGSADAHGLQAGVKAEDFPSNIVIDLRAKGSKVGISIGKAAIADDDFDAIRAKLSEINMPNLNVLLRAEASLSVQQVAKAMDAVLASPMKKVSISGLPQQSNAPKTPPMKAAS